MKIKDCDIDDLCGHLQRLSTTGRKLGFILRDNDINGSHLKLLTKSQIDELCNSIGLKIELLNLIDNRENEVGWDDRNNKDKFVKKPSSINIHPHHSGISCIVKDQRQTEKTIQLSSHGFDFSSLSDGSYEAKFMYSKDLSRPIVLQKSNFTKSGTTITPSFIDLSSSFVSLEFNSEDNPASGCSLIGKVDLASSTINGATSLDINSQTNDRGQYSMIMPEGIVSINVTGVVDGKKVDIKEKVKIEPSFPVKSIDDAKNVEIISITTSSKCSKFNIKSKGLKVLYLNDVSGSMSTHIGDKESIEYLKEFTLNEIYKYINNPYPYKAISFCAWENSTTSPDKGKWISMMNGDKFISWAKGLRASGGTNMKQAIEYGIANYPDAEEFIVCCDGDASAFTLDSWRDFCKKNSKYMISFVGIGNCSDELMKQMAQIGRGTYSKIV